MGKIIIDNPVCTIDGDDHSDHFKSVAIDLEFAEVDLTAFGATFSETGVGLGTAAMEFEAFQDFTSNELHQNMWPIFINKTAVEITVKHTSAVVSATNPKFTMTGRLFTYSPFTGEKGEAAMTTLTFKNASQTGIVQSYT